MSEWLGVVSLLYHNQLVVDSISKQGSQNLIMVQTYEAVFPRLSFVLYAPVQSNLVLCINAVDCQLELEKGCDLKNILHTV